MLARLLTKLRLKVRIPLWGIISAAVWVPGAALAQTAAYAPLGSGVVISDGGVHFIVAIIAGVILAFAFQAVLTALSFALGLSLTPNLMKAEASRKASRHVTEIEDEEEPDDHAQVKTGIINSLGLWALATTSIALFGASWLAIRLNFFQPDKGVILSLVIWATFFLFTSYLELRGVRSLIGGIMSIASTNLHAGIDSIRGLAAKSQVRKVEQYGRQTARGIYEELSELAHKDRLDRKLSKYLQQLKPGDLDFDKIHDEIVDILSRIRLEQNVNINEEQVERIFTVRMEDNRFLNRENVAKLAQTAKKAARTAQNGESMIDKAGAAAGKAISLSADEVKALEERFLQFLKETGREELNPESLRADIEDMIAHPEAAVDIVRARASHFDRETVKAIITQSEQIDEDKAAQLVDKVLDIFGDLQARYQEAAGTTGNALTVLSGALPRSIEKKLADYFKALDRPELNYEAIKMDVEDILHDPKAAPAIVKNRLSQMDEETLVALVRSNSWISPEQAEILVHQITESFDKVTENVSRLQAKALSQYERVRYQTILAAETARENAIAASWWVVATAVLSGGAAMLGGYVAGVV